MVSPVDNCQPYQDLRESTHLITTPKRCKLAVTYLYGVLRMVSGLKREMLYHLLDQVMA
jgi:hypothetical protein